MGKGKTSGMISLIGKTSKKMKPLGHHVISQESYKPKGKTMQQVVNELTRSNKNGKS